MKKSNNPLNTDNLPSHGNRNVSEPEGSIFKDILFLLLKIGAVILIFALIFTFLFGVCRNADGSMAPAIKEGDLAIFYRLDKNYLIHDTVVLEFGGEKQVRRVMAAAGDTVDITEEGLLVNGALQQETDIYFPTLPYADGVRFPLTLSEGQIFVLGDSRENATDSRIYGAVEIKDTLGKVMTILRRRNI